MGGCATKPKVLKADDRSIPAPPPESTKEAIAEASEAKEGGLVVAEKGDQKAEVDVVGEDVKSKDVDEAEKVDDESNTRQSLGNLLNENEKKGVAETETVIEADNNTPSEPTKTEPAEQESAEEKVPAEPIESAKEPEPLSVEPEAAPEATATVDAAATEKNETSAAVAEGEEGKSEVAK
ncbi:hypothetical protein HRI_000531200 [Hibiscus trionum]|uniref:Uncharacterized protein n=1 Tax=Hibiscus trionum TaxID=183268 RepID=A0A9W7H004_HIBTR|nr:hypothetical protein HRI_000531200 [Hibiscus trionum]